MIINNDSIFYKIDGNIFPAKDLLYIDAIRHTAQIIDISYSRLVLTLLSEENNLQNELAISDGLSIVGSLNRLRALLEKAPNISHNLPWYKNYYHKIKIVKDIRDFLEHFDEKIQSQIENDNFTLGYIGWAELKDDKTIVTKILFSLRVKNSAVLKVINPTGKEFRWKLDHITFYINDSAINLSDMYYGLIEFINNYETYIKSKIINTI